MRVLLKIAEAGQIAGATFHLSRIDIRGDARILDRVAGQVSDMAFNRPAVALGTDATPTNSRQNKSEAKNQDAAATRSQGIDHH
jgi:hypothetical protein